MCRLAHLTERFVEVFSQLRPADEVQLAERIEARGGVHSVRNNEAALREIFKAENASVRTVGASAGTDGSKQRASGRMTQQSEYTFTDFKSELREDWDTSLQKNFKAFEGKFNLFYNRLEDNLQKYMKEATDRVISEVNKGPHDLIHDPVRDFFHTCKLFAVTDVSYGSGTEIYLERDGAVQLLSHAS